MKGREGERESRNSFPSQDGIIHVIYCLWFAFFFLCAALTGQISRFALDRVFLCKLNVHSNVNARTIRTSSVASACKIVIQIISKWSSTKSSAYNVPAHTFVPLRSVAKCACVCGFATLRELRNGASSETRTDSILVYVLTTHVSYSNQSHSSGSHRRRRSCSEKKLLSFECEFGLHLVRVYFFVRFRFCSFIYFSIFVHFFSWQHALVSSRLHFNRFVSPYAHSARAIHRHERMHLSIHFPFVFSVWRSQRAAALHSLFNSFWFILAARFDGISLMGFSESSATGPSTDEQQSFCVCQRFKWNIHCSCILETDVVATRTTEVSSKSNENEIETT